MWKFARFYKSFSIVLSDSLYIGTKRGIAIYTTTVIPAEQCNNFMRPLTGLVKWLRAYFEFSYFDEVLIVGRSWRKSVIRSSLTTACKRRRRCLWKGEISFQEGTVLVQHLSHDCVIAISRCTQQECHVSRK